MCIRDSHIDPCEAKLTLRFSQSGAVLIGGGGRAGVAGGGVGPHERMVVFGCGPIGMLALLTGKAAGAPVIAVEPHPYRRRMASELGADVTVDPLAGDMEEQVRSHTGGRGRHWSWNAPATMVHEQAHSTFWPTAGE